jgi:polar amino acid transport system substrate-binding protein
MSTSRLLSRAVVLPAVALAALSLAGCGSKSATDAGGAHLITAGTLTVCSDVPYAPMEDFDNNSPIGFKGFDIDLINAIAQDLNLKLVVKDSDFSALKSGVALNTNQCDLIASSMTINPARQAVMDFSDPYFDADQSLLVPDGSPIKTLADLNGKKLGVQSTTTGEDYAKAHATGATLVAMPDDGTEFQALKAGQVDALLQDLPVNQAHADAGGFTVVETYKTNEAYGFAMKKGNTALVQEVDAALKKIKGDGEYQQLHDKYFPKK